MPVELPNCITLYDSDINFDVYDGDWGSLTLSPITTCNVISTTEQALNISTNDVVFVLPTQSDTSKVRQ